ncbi:TrkA C-terminal domain-containing protein [Methanolobus zinderi]|uniref:TrkA C-terminal domain-containing protein n=1 Tax=Methanolobus zinderi TaxID=536044 RepID=A0A7D5E7W1_9EURY|nr:TrkA C-terminal domain-containing protein [Methanolobus zinderi]QLC49899.1 TrkA C-terminal domain-containing protein [Methanolobus zinderi]
MAAALVTLFAIVILSLIVTRIATIALTLTGMSSEVARFQARSALTGAGFTTSESETMMSHPIRRRIIMTLMLVGNAGIVTVIASIILVSVNIGSTSWLGQITIIAAGLMILLALTQSRWVDKNLTRLINFALMKWTSIETTDTASLIYLGGEYQVSELEIEPEDWLADKTLAEMNLPDEGVLILGIQKPNGEYNGTPHASTKIRIGDILLLYGSGKSIHSLDVRRKGIIGEVEHERAIIKQKKMMEEQIEDKDESNEEDEG